MQYKAGYMLKTRWFAVLGLVWTMLATNPAFGQSKLDDRVEGILSEFESVRVLVTMPPPGSDGPDEPTDFVAEVLDGNGRNIRRIADLPVVVAETDRDGIDALVQRPEVTHIFADEPVPPLLDASLQTLRVDEVHSAGVLGDGYSVVVLDTGVDYDHPLVSGKLRAEGCFSARSDADRLSLCGGGDEIKDLSAGAGRNCDLPGCDHGTHVSGIAVGAQNVTVGGNAISGVAPGAGLISIQVFTRFNDAKKCGENPVPCIKSYPSSQLEALRHVRNLASPEHNHDIASVNMSLGGGKKDVACESHPLADEILKLRELGILTVVASGNDGYDHAINFPACISAAVTVGASPRERVERETYSNTSALVDFLAPGTKILSATDGGYGRKTGTSMAAPHVAGLIALLKSQVPSASADVIEFALKLTARKMTDTRTGVTLNFPNARGALDALISSARRNEPAAREFASFTEGIVGAKRIMIQRGTRVMTARDSELAKLIAATLGRDAVVRPLGGGIYLAESRAPFDSESLSRLVSELGADTKLYRDDPVAPGALAGVRTR